MARTLAFWHAVLNETASLCRMIERTPVSLATWRAQREIQEAKDEAEQLALGFSTLFLNWVNRSGIITGGVIGGQEQKGRWKLDARYSASVLVARIKRIARYRDRIILTRMDAIDLLEDLAATKPRRTLLYLDPPYYVKLDHYTGDILLPERIHLYLLRRQFGEPLESYLERCRIADYVKHYGSGRSGSCLSRRRRTQRRSRPCRSWAATDQWAVKAV